VNAMNVMITKAEIAKSWKGLYSITLNLKLMDGQDELLNQNFSQHYRTGQNIEDITARFKEDMQQAINDYKEEQALYNKAKFDTAIIDLQNSLVI
jgi:hypothetical protein